MRTSLYDFLHKCDSLCIPTCSIVIVSDNVKDVQMDSTLMKVQDAQGNFICYFCIKDFSLSLDIVIIELMLVKVQCVMRNGRGFEGEGHDLFIYVLLH